MTTAESDVPENLEPGTQVSQDQELAKTSSQTTDETSLRQQRISKILDEVLADTSEMPATKFKHPMLLDMAISLGLLIIMVGFAAGLFRMYITHSAWQSISQHNYKSAIAILRGSPVPSFLSNQDYEARELLSQALYLDAMDKIEFDNNLEGALKELGEIPAGSHYFALAQEIIREHFAPAPTTLQGSAEHLEMDPLPKERSSPFSTSESPDEIQQD